MTAKRKPKTAKRAAPDAISELAGQLRAGDRRALARAITLIESTRADHRRDADALLQKLLPATGKSIRIGISGVPGVGKSTFIEAFGLDVIKDKHRVAVLAIDPSSRRGGGSILGDKTRMAELSAAPQAFIRPSPSGGTLGGVARRTREALLACEAAGFDVVLVETVGVGQSETAVADMTDVFLLLLQPGGGDELQGLKKGIIEIADLLVVNKADGDLKAAAKRTAGDYGAALRLLRPSSPNWTPEVMQCSALEGTGIAEVWQAITRYREKMTASGELKRRRAEQAKSWMWSEVTETLDAALRTHKGVRSQVAALESKVAAGETTPSQAAHVLLAAFAGAGKD
jgi:LAO/AO transport system kinase